MGLDLVEQIAAEWRMISQAPLSFVIAALALAALVFAALKWRYGGTIASLEGRLTLKEDQLAAYKTKLDGRTPDEVKTQLDTLEARLRQLEPRRLHDDHRKALSVAVSKFSGHIVVARDMSVPDTLQFAGDLAWAFQNAGWDVETPTVLGPGNPPPTGLALRVSDPANLTPAQAVIFHALTRAGQHLDVQKITHSPLNLHETEIWVTAKLS